MFLVLFCSRRTAYIVRVNAKTFYITRFISQGCNIIFKKNYVFDVVYVKSGSISYEFCDLNYVATL